MTEYKNRISLEKREHIRRYKEQKESIEAEKELKTIGKWLFFPAIILFIILFISISVLISHNKTNNILVNSAIFLTPALIFIALGFLSKNKPYLATASGLIVFFIFIVILLLFGQSLLSGILWKLPILFSLIQGFRVALKNRKNKINNSSNIIDDIDF